MPSLILLKSPPNKVPPEGERIDLGGGTLVIGREPSPAARDNGAQVIIKDPSISRQHGRVTRRDGAFFIEDLKSRNGTYLNNRRLEPNVPAALSHGDRVKFCDFLYRFEVVPEDRHQTSGSPVSLDEDDPNTTSTVHASMARRVAPRDLLGAAPSEKLQALLDISAALGKVRAVDELLPLIGKTLIGLFRQADRCFVIEYDEESQHLIPRVIRTRRESDGTERFSRTIVRKCLQDGQAYLSEDASQDTGFGSAQSIADFRIRSVMCVPVVLGDGRMFGVIQLDGQDRTKKFTDGDLRFLIGVANQAAVAVENARLYQDELKRAKEQQEHELARRVQLSFLPKGVPDLQGYEFFTHYEAARYVGGDFYDFIPLDESRLAVVLCDVSGKGVPAALLVARLSNEAKLCLSAHPHDPRAAVAMLNDQLTELNIPDSFVTMVVAVLDLEADMITMLSAGHEMPRLHRADGSLAEAMGRGVGGLPLCVVPGGKYEAATFEARPGDTLILFTDGVIDALNRQQERFSVDGVARALELESESALGGPASGSGPPRPREVGNRILDALKRHSEGVDQFDDIALICFGRLPPEAKAAGGKTTMRLPAGR